MPKSLHIVFPNYFLATMDKHRSKVIADYEHDSYDKGWAK